MGERRYVYMFDEGSAEKKKLLGGKGANLAEMTRLGLPVPPGFTVSTEACIDYFKKEQILEDQLKEDIKQGVQQLERRTNKTLGGSANPLLLSVRSGAYYSMPGMMDTILNLGLNDKTVQALAEETQDTAFAMDCYRRFLQMYGEVVFKLENYQFDRLIDNVCKSSNVPRVQKLPPEGWSQLVEKFKQLVADEKGVEFPQDPFEQLLGAIEAVFDSWNNPRAVVYRRLNQIPDDLGTAVNIQSMVFGNLGEESGTGVAFTRNPSTGDKELYGEFLFNAQGEDVVAGTNTPMPLLSLQDKMPHVYEQLAQTCEKLEEHYGDMQDVEFTVEKGKLYLLQTRTGKRTAGAAVKIAVELVQDGKCTPEEALLRIEPSQLVQLLHKRIEPNAYLTSLARGLPASPGAASGVVVFDADLAEKKALEGERVILVRSETTPDDIHGIVAAQGVLTSRGGMTSHAAVVARGMGKPCISGCEAARIMASEGYLLLGEEKINEGALISIDGTTGFVYRGEVPLIYPELSPEFQLLLSWADEQRVLGVRANADTQADASKAKEFGAEGIGLCRTEHMFMEQDRLPVVQEMILSETEEERAQALEKLLPMQQGDFEQILSEMNGLPTTIRLLDPPLHEFLPNLEELMVEIARMEEKGEHSALLAEKKALLNKIRSLNEFNPMLGHRGCRLGLVYPEIYRMQVRAICLAVASLNQKGIEVKPEIMIPLVGHFKELQLIREMVEDEVRSVKEETGVDFCYTIGTMIELPRACVTAGDIANYADFFSFGTNDLTQTVFGFSRDDAEGKFLPFYVQQKILPENPFMVLDREGVGKLISQAVSAGKASKPEIKMGICGEHGGDPGSIEFFHQVGLDYVSCSPFRVPIARLAAAQAALKESGKEDETRNQV